MSDTFVIVLLSNIYRKSIIMVTTRKGVRVQLLARVPKSLKDRIDTHKENTSRSRGFKCTQDEVIISAVEMYLKKFED